MKSIVMSRTDKPYSDDFAGATDSSCWVIDGATGCYKSRLCGYPSDANWYGGAINGYFTENVDDSARSLEDIAADAVEYAGAEYARMTHGAKTSPDAYPSATAAVGRINGGKLETFLIGDCSIIVSLKGRVTSAHDERGRRFEAPLIRDMHDYQQRTGCGVTAAREHFSERFRSNRAFKNRNGGYYVLEFDRSAVSHGILNSFPVGDVDGLLLMTDGFYRSVDVFKIFADDAALLRAAVSSGLDAVWEEISRREREDPDCLKYPRTKKSDDCSAVLSVRRQF